MKHKEWDIIITPKPRLIQLNLSYILKYKDLLILLVQRDVVTVYKQTILGPLWYLLQPLFTTLIFTIVFGRISNISTDNIPHTLFYFIGVVLWSYFSENLNKVSSTFISNQDVFGKVYFPRVIVPAATVISNLGKLFIQLFLFSILWFYFNWQKPLSPTFALLGFPFVILALALISLGLGMLFSSLTSKYRDLQFLLAFGIQLWMYATPIIYPFSAIPDRYELFLSMNPITPLVELTRFGFFGAGYFTIGSILYSLSFSIIIFFLGLIVFNRVEKTFMDTV